MGEYAERGPLDLAPSKGGLYTKEGTNREHGNSYLALVEYVGLLGILPFALLVFLVMRMIVQVCVWMRGNVQSLSLCDSFGDGLVSRFGPCLL